MSMQTVLFIIIILIMVIVSMDILIFLLKPKFTKIKYENKKSEKTELKERTNKNDHDFIVVEVEFKGYKGTYTYNVAQQTVFKGQYVLVLTRDGIRCAEVVTDPKATKSSQLKIPPFLLESIVCIADEVDLDYYA